MTVFSPSKATAFSLLPFKVSLHKQSWILNRAWNLTASSWRECQVDRWLLLCRGPQLVCGWCGVPSRGLTVHCTVDCTLHGLAVCALELLCRFCKTMVVSLQSPVHRTPGRGVQVGPVCPVPELQCRSTQVRCLRTCTSCGMNFYLQGSAAGPRVPQRTKQSIVGPS